MLTSRKPIVVVGSINLDLVTNADHIPAAGETVQGRGFQMHPGGKGANQAVAIATLGYPVHLIGKLGSDVLGEQLWSHLQSAGVGLAGVEKTEGASGTAVIVVGSRGENCIVVTPGANAQVLPGYIDSHLDLIRSAGMVLTQLEIPIETVEHLADLCFQENIPLMLDPAPAKPLSPSLFKRISWFTPNETEANFYAHQCLDGSRGTDPSLTAALLLNQGSAGVILKMGSRGAYVAADGIEQQLSAFAVEAIDTTAAGDALNGAFAVGLMSGKTPVESVRFAVAAASLSVTRAGAQTSMPTLAEVTRMLDGRQ
ncbi:MAG: ribokinase [Silvibacterium sp.]